MKLARWIALCGAALASAEAAPLDYVIRGARVLDGTGAPWFYADVGVTGDRIVTVGEIVHDTPARETIDGRGLYLAPGFIDGHSHSGGALAEADRADVRLLVTQGVTTVFINPDGGGPAELGPQLDAIRAARPAINVAPLIGHNAVRIAVLGYENRAPTPAELARMQELVRGGFAAGAFGFSSGPFYTPGNFSQTDELVALAKVAAENGGFYTSHIRDEGDYNIGVVAAVDEVITIAREAGLPGVVTHIKALGPHVWGSSAEIVRHIEAARAEGVEVWADQYPYEASSTSLAAALLPPWAHAGGAKATRARLADPALREKLRAAIEENLERRGGAHAIQICEYRSEPRLQGRRLDEIAQERQLDAVDTVIALLTRGPAAIVSFNMNPEDIERFMRQPWTMTCSDGDAPVWGKGVPHPRGYGAFARKLRRYALDRPVLTLEQAVHSMTGLSATVFRVPDRGFVRPGALADLVLFEAARLRDTATYEHPHAYAEGMVYVFVNGAPVIARGEVTGARPGRVLLHRR